MVVKGKLLKFILRISVLSLIQQEESHLSLGSDAWTDNHRQLSYLSICTSHVTKGFHYKRHSEVKHTGQNIADAVNRTHREFGRSNRKFHYVTDQGANMISAGKLLKFTRSACMAHLLDLVISKDSIPKVDELAGLVTRLQGIVKFFFASKVPESRRNRKRSPIYDDQDEDLDKDEHDIRRESGGAENISVGARAQAIPVDYVYLSILFL